MSLAVLIHSVSKSLNISEDIILKDLNIMVDLVKDEVFKKNIFKTVQIEDNTVNRILIEGIKLAYVSKFLEYECLTEDSIDYAVVIEEECQYCGESISNVATHILDESFRFNNAFLKLVSEYKNSELDKYLMPAYTQNLERLKRKLNIIPFLGAGVSIPFNLPSWKALLLEFKKGMNSSDESLYIRYLESGDYMKALTFLRRYSTLYNSEEILKKDIKEHLTSKYNKFVNSNEHNIVDILNLEPQIVLTTNYDNIISEQLVSQKNGFTIPKVLTQLEDLPDLLSDRKTKVIHLHGNMDMPNTMIVTSEDYEKLYSDDKINYILNGIMSHKTLLFIGFSFDDQYFKDLYKKIYNNIQGEHFIIAPNLHPFQAIELQEEKLIPIGINVKEDKSDYVKALRIILEQLV